MISPLAKGQTHLPSESLLQINRGVPIAGSPFTISRAISPRPTSVIVSQLAPKEHKAILITPEMRGDASRLTRVKDDKTLKAEEEMLQEKLKQIDRDVFKAMKEMVKELPKELERRQANKEKTLKEKRYEEKNK